MLVSLPFLQASHNYRERGMNTLYLTPELDDQAVPRKIVPDRDRSQATSFL